MVHKLLSCQIKKARLRGPYIGEPFTEDWPFGMVINRATRLALGLGAAVLFLWLVLRDVKFSDVVRILGTAKPGWISAATALFLGGYACRIERWRLMLRHENPRVRWVDCAGPFLASFAANNTLPLRAGDVLRVFAFNRPLGAGPGVIAATMFVERLLDLLMVLSVLGSALAIFDLRASRYAGFSGIGLLCFAFFVLLMLFFSHHLKPALLRLANAIARIWPKVGTKLFSEVERSLDTLRTLTQGSTMLRLVIWSAVAWGLEALVYVLSALAIPALASPLGGYFALPLTAFATLIPSAPGYIGTFDFFAVRAMTALGNSGESATAYAALVHIVIWLPITLLGGLYWLRSSRN